MRSPPSALHGAECTNVYLKHVLALRDKYAATPASANNLLRCLSSMLSWSVPRGWRADNPCDHVKKLKGSEPYEPWPWEAIELLREAAPPELWWVAALALYTGQRQGDVLQMKLSDVREGAVSVVQEKTGVKLWVPIHRSLAPCLPIFRGGRSTYLQARTARPGRRTASEHRGAVSLGG